MSEPTPENPPTDEGGTEPTPAPTDEGGGTTTEPAPADEGGGDEGTPTPADDETPPDEGTGGGDEGGGGTEEPPPPVELPPPPDYQMGVSTIVGELMDEATAPRWSTQMADLAGSVHTVYDFILPIAYEMSGTDEVSRRMARDAVSSLLVTRLVEEIQGAEAAAELADRPAEPEPTPPPAPVEPPAEG